MDEVRVRRLLFLYVPAAGGVLASLLVPQPVFQAARTSGITGIVAGALLIALAGLLGSWPLARARLERPITRWAVPRWLRLPQLATDPLSRISLAARRPQGVLVPLAAVAVIACVWLLPPQNMPGNALVRMTARTSWSLLSSSTAAKSANFRSRLTAFIASGRFNVNVATPLSRSISSTSLIGGGYRDPAPWCRPLVRENKLHVGVQGGDVLG